MEGKKQGDNKFSVLMSVYKNDKPNQVEQAINSVYFDQTVKPEEIVLIVDGPVSEDLLKSISQKEKEINILKVFKQEENLGLGNTLNNGLAKCQNEIVARMDADDISMPDRFEKELAELVSKELDIVGSNIAEFCDDPNDIVACRVLPTDDDEIKKFMRQRCPFSHPSVMFKKSIVLKAGGYQHLHYCEDYYLWVRMALAGAKMGNIDQNLVKMRINQDTYMRRSGKDYFNSHKTLFKFMRKNKMISYFCYLKNICIRFIAEVVISNKMRQKLYQKYLRKEKKD